MSGASASKTLLSIRIASLQKSGEQITEEKQKEMLKEIQDRYDSQTHALYGAARLWTDGVIDPRRTREIISLGIEMASHNPDIPKFNPGVIQT
jgi:acetyl-CoA carboxylase carboxyltransferase component